MDKMIKEWPVLFHHSKNGLRSWKVWVDEIGVNTEYGLIESKRKQLSIIELPLEEALRRAQSMWTHKVERKYRQTPDDAENLDFFPMLANKYSEDAIYNGVITLPVTVQPKINGMRCTATIEGLESRQGKEIIIPQLLNEIRGWLPDHLRLDGELYIHGYALEDIISAVRQAGKPGSNWGNFIQFIVYDIIDELNPLSPWFQRAKLLKDIVEIGSRVKRIRSVIAGSHEEILKWEKEFVSHGFEGAIVRDKFNIYENSRSNTLLKVKSRDSDEFKIVGADEGEGNMQGKIIWECETKDEDPTKRKRFRAGHKCTLAKRAYYWSNKERYYGSLLTVEYFGYTKEGKPFNPVAVAIRDYE